MRMPKQLPAVEKKRVTICANVVAGGVRPAQYYGGLTSQVTPLCRLCAESGCMGSPS
jgi:hypothetical protein